MHEIRTPLSLIRLPLEKLLEKEREGKDLKYVSVIDKNVNYLLVITNELLDFQKMESGTPVSYTHLDVYKRQVRDWSVCTSNKMNWIRLRLCLRRW